MASETHVPRILLVTGGAGFIGCNFVRHVLARHRDLRVINLDALTYAGSLANLEGIEQRYGERYRFVHGDIRDADLVRRIFREEGVDTVAHFAAESHVDRSIDGPADFLETNVMGTFTLLEAAREAWAGRGDVRFHHISTDEVYGSLDGEGFFTETTPYDPSSPYSASKAASDHLVRAWHHTYGLPVTLTNCSNNYGPWQFPEKLIPRMICEALAGRRLEVYGDGRHVRDWLYVEDHCEAVDRVLHDAPAGREYNIGGHNEWANLDLVHLLCDLLDEARPRPGGGSYREQIVFVEDRPGHDRRYAIHAGRIETELGWRPARTFREGLRQTVRWYLDHQDWLDRIRSERYQGDRLGLGEAEPSP